MSYPGDVGASADGPVRLLQVAAVAANEAKTVEQAMQACVDAICAYCGWPAGHYYASSPEGTELLPSSVWHLDDADRFGAFRRVTEALRLRIGDGLPGRVLASGRPEWVSDFGADPDLLGYREAAGAGIAAAFAFPVLVGTEVVGVVEFFTTAPAEPDLALLEVMSQIGTQLGRVVERSRAAAALEDSEERMRLVVETAGDAFVGMNAEGTITDWNAAAETLFGWSRAEAIGRRLSETIIPERYRDAHEKGLTHFLATGEAAVFGHRLELEALHRNGHEIPMELSIWPVRQERSVRFNAFVHDITERNANEVALARARDEALAASRAKSEFLAIMSHEIRTPMNGVIGLTGLLLESELTETQRHYALGVRASGEALLAIINDILDFSKIDAGKLELETVDFELANAVEEVAALVAETARAKELELVAHCQPEVPSALRGDVGRLRQILLNFATNAVKFTPTGEVVVRAMLAEEPTSDGAVVRFEVTDTGVGLDAADAARLFEPFSQGDASTTRRHGGTGLGLAICRRLAEAMGGTVGVDSQLGHGSTFWLRLPLLHASAPVNYAVPAGHLLAGHRALVVDDNQTSRVVLGSQLQAWDMAVDLACDAEEALVLLHQAAAESRPYELALVDMAMPRMDGMTLAGLINADPSVPPVTLLLLSSVSVEAEVAAAAGFVARLIKPVRLSSLYEALLRVVAPGSIEAAGAAPTQRNVPTGVRGTLLIVEDHAINREVARGIVAKLGYGSDMAGNGLEALEALERRSYDAVLMDCHMPEMDGFEATAEIRTREAGGRRVPVIAMTAGAMVEDREKCIAAGMDDYLAKPINEHELAAALSRWVGGHAGSDGATDLVKTESPTAAFGPEAPKVRIDQHRLKVLRAMGPPDRSSFARLVDAFLTSAPADLGALHDAAAGGDTAEVQRMAHRLRGAAANLGAPLLAQLCAGIESAANVGNLSSAIDLVCRAEAELVQVDPALRAACHLDRG